MSNNNKRPIPPGGKRSGLLLFTPIMAAMLAGSTDVGAAAKASVSAKTKFDTNGHLLVTGAAKGIAAGSQVTISDAASNQILYSTKIDSKGKFNISFPADQAALCKIKVESGTAVSLIGVSKSPSCKTAPSCVIANGDQKISVGGSVNLSILASKTAKTDPLQFRWNVSNTGPTLPANDTVIEPTAIGSTLTHSFSSPGLYQVALTGSNAGGTCNDNITVSVSPSTTPSKVEALAAAAKATAPATGSALNAATGSYVVLPFEETGMQGGSQINLPFNPMIPYNSLNAQILVKEAHKPQLRSNAEVDIYYSASANPNDPVGSDSINSTSQNWFGEGKAGSNNNYAASIYDGASLAPTKNVFIDGQDFADATIRKTEQWDRLYQKNRALDVQNSIDNAWQQNRFTPAKRLAKLDEGIRGNLDNGENPRTMPGIGKPYEANDPQSTVYNPDQTAFVAQFIPISNVDDKGRTNPYPLMRVEATLKGDLPTPDKIVAKADTVYTSASETRCRECHLPGGIAADDVVWRTPVSEDELLIDADGDGNKDEPGPTTGAGSYDPGTLAITDHEFKPWPPAIHNHFDDTHPDKADFTNLIANSKDLIPRDANNRRMDRVKESRWVKLDAQGKPPVLDASGNPTDASKVSATPPSVYMDVINDPANSSKTEGEKIMLANKAAHAAGWTIQFKIKFKSAADYGDANDPILQEKAALFNTLVMHDYMAFYGPTPATGKTVPAGYSSQLADGFTEEDTGKDGAKPQYYCSGHHQSQLKFDVGIGAKVAATNRSDYSRAFHAFHGKMQQYKVDVSAAESADGRAHKAGELIRDSRGHPLMYGGRGWDSQKDDDNGLPLIMQVQRDGNNDPVLDANRKQILLDPPFVDNTQLKGTNPESWNSSYFSVPTWDPAKNNWRPDLFPMHSKGKLLLETGNKIAMEDNCVICHTGKTEKSYRDIHHAAGLKCDNCHGGMLETGNVFPNEGYDANLSWAGAFGKDTDNGYATADPKKGDAEALKVAVANLGISEPADFRRPWLDMPDCGSCHIGDANGETASMPGMYMPVANQFSAGVLKQAWADGDKTAKSMMPMNARFAVMPNKEDRLEKYSVLYTKAEADALKLADPNSKIKKGDTKETLYLPQPLSQALYRKSGDVHGSKSGAPLTCSTCHGGSHAIWPNPDPKANDNVTAKQLQGYDGNIAECSVCHIKDDFKTGLVSTDGGTSGLGVAQGIRENSETTLAAPNASDSAQKSFLAGPHGMHPVNDESWWKNVDGNVIHVDAFKSKVGNGGWHSEMTYKSGPDGYLPNHKAEDQCAACHGADHKGTRLSKTLTARTFVTDKGKTIKVEAGQVIGCDLCHKIDVSWARSNPKDAKSAKVEWGAPEMHMPPMPESISPVPGSGGHGH